MTVAAYERLLEQQAGAPGARVLRVEELVPMVEALEPLPDDERARVLLYCLLKYAPSEFSNGDLFGLLDRARNAAAKRPTTG